MAAANSDMRVVIAGAGGRMGRTLIHAVAATKGMVLAGAIDAPDSAVIGRDAGELAGLGPNGVKVTSDAAALAAERRRARRIRHCRRRRWRLPNRPPPPARSTSSAPPAIPPRRKR